MKEENRYLEYLFYLRPNVIKKHREREFNFVKKQMREIAKKEGEVIKRITVRRIRKKYLEYEGYEWGWFDEIVLRGKLSELAA